MSKRMPWFDATTNDPLIDNYAQKMDTFLTAVADGFIDDKEIAAQEKRVIDLMKEVEPKLDDETHAKVTRLLCEVTAYDIMNVMRQMQQTRQMAKFRG